MEASEAEDRLLQDLFAPRPYNTLSRPVRDHTHSVQVTFGLNLLQIVDIVRTLALMPLPSPVFNTTVLGD